MRTAQIKSVSPCGITADQILTIIRGNQPADAEGESVEEIVARTGLSRDRVLRSLKEAQRRGLLILGHKTVENLRGYPYRQPVYQIRRSDNEPV